MINLILTSSPWQLGAPNAQPTMKQEQDTERPPINPHLLLGNGGGTRTTCVT